MRWFKHLSMAHEDEALSGVIEEMGVDGCRANGIYWSLLEAVAGPMEKDCTTPQLTHSDIKWASICHCSVRVFRSIARRFAFVKLIELNSIDNRTQIVIPNLLKYRDEYTQRSGPSPDKLPARSDTDQIQIRVETPPTPSSEGELVETPNADPPPPLPKTIPKIDQEFEEDWPQFWVQLGKKGAREAYRKARKEISREVLMQAVLAQGPPILRRAKSQGSTPVYPATWLNDGRYGDNQRHLEGLAAMPARASPISRRDKANEEFVQRQLREAKEKGIGNEEFDYTAGS